MKTDKVVLLGLMAIISIIGIVWKDFAPFVIVALMGLLYMETSLHDKTEEQLEAMGRLVATLFDQDDEANDGQSKGP
jgi:hypothetical protein